MPKLTHEYKKEREEKKKELVLSCLGVFAFKKKGKITVKDITDAAKISHGLFYHYFKSVDEIYDEAFKLDEIKEIEKSILLYDQSLGLLAYNKLEKVTNYILSIKNDKIKINSLLFLVSDLRFKNDILNLIKLGQRQGDVTGGDPEEILSVYIHFLIDYLHAKIYKRENEKISSDLVMNIFRKRTYK